MRYSLCNVRSLSAEAVKGRRYDIFIAALGYESRCVHAFGSLEIQASKKIAIAFTDQTVCAFEDNKKFFVKHQFNVREIGDSEVTAAIMSCVETDEANVCIDISSFTRGRLASILVALLAASKQFKRVLGVDFVYSFATYTPPPDEFAPINSSGPVCPFFSGWTNNPDFPSSLIIGVGYERGKAVGVVEGMEPSSVWVFLPEGGTGKYDETVMTANIELLASFANDKGKIRRYPVNAPYRLFTELEALVFGLSKESRPIIVPMGPKIFGLCALLTGLAHYPSVGIWRVSGGVDEPAVDRAASGEMAYLSASIDGTLLG